MISLKDFLKARIGKPAPGLRPTRRNIVASGSWVIRVGTIDTEIACPKCNAKLLVKSEGLSVPFNEIPDDRALGLKQHYSFPISVSVLELKPEPKAIGQIRGLWKQRRRKK